MLRANGIIRTVDKHSIVSILHGGGGGVGTVRDEIRKSSQYFWPGLSEYVIDHKKQFMSLELRKTSLISLEIDVGSSVGRV